MDGREGDRGEEEEEEEEEKKKSLTFVKKKKKVDHQEATRLHPVL